METVMDWRLLVGSVITIGIAVTHSVLGERRIIAPGFNASFGFSPTKRGDFIRLTLRFAWHLTSLFMFACAALLLAVAVAPIDLASILSLEILGALFVASAAITGSYSKGQHIAWPLFTIVGVLCWWTAIQHDGAVSFEGTKPFIGLATAIALMLIGILHLYWAIRGPANLVAVIPEKNGKPIFCPSRIGTAAVAVGIILASVLVAEQSAGTKFLMMPGATRIGCWLTAVLLIARAVGDFRYVGLFKADHMSTFAYCDTAAYTPLCLLLGLSVTVSML
ncbi:DUF3995 domain-containing protein [Ochrobactrum soli]|nr:DUF3995 domain-containing protein [[Ochrobactrum] soli]